METLHSGQIRKMNVPSMTMGRQKLDAANSTYVWKSVSYNLNSKLSVIWAPRGMLCVVHVAWWVEISPSLDLTS